MEIRELRQTIKMTQRQFAICFGIPLGTLRNWEQGISKPPEYVFTMIFAGIRRDKMINVETLKFLTILNELAELTEGGFDDFSNANEANWGTKVFYDSRKSEDGRFPVVMDACIIDDPKCSHHDIICYYDSDQNEFTVNAVRDEYDDTYLIQVDFMYSKKKIGIQNGDWYFA